MYHNKSSDLGFFAFIHIDFSETLIENHTSYRRAVLAQVMSAKFHGLLISSDDCGCISSLCEVPH